MKQFYSHGKLLLTGEYAVLDGAKALALPCKLGQYLSVKPSVNDHFSWTSYLADGTVWENVNFNLDDILHQRGKGDFSHRLFQLLKILYDNTPALFDKPLNFSTRLEFDKNWGLGSSSTLINNLAQWAEKDPYSLLQQSFGGSGYDIAAAREHTPFIYQKNENTIPVNISDNLKPHLYFIYLNQKQNSRDAIKHYRMLNDNEKTTWIEEISLIAEEISKTNDISEFEKLMTTHEALISKLIHIQPVQKQKFSTYKNGIVKSLGAWGGDFILVTAHQKSDLDYFSKRGFNTIFEYEALILD